MDLRHSKFIATVIFMAVMSGCVTTPTEPGLNVDLKNYSLSDVPPGTIVLDLPSQTIKAVRFDDDGGVNSLWNISENVRYRQVCNIESWKSGNVNRQREIKRVWRNGSDDYIPTERVEQVYDSSKEIISALRAEKLPDNQMIKIRCNLAEKGPVFINTQRLRDGCAVVSIGDRTHVLQVSPDWFGGGHIKSMTLSNSQICGKEAESILSRFGKQITLDSAPQGTYVLSRGRIVAVHRFGDGRAPNKFLVAESGQIITSMTSPHPGRDGAIYALGVAAVDQLGVSSKPTENGCIRDITPGTKWTWRANKIWRYSAAEIIVGRLVLIAPSKCE